MAKEYIAIYKKRLIAQGDLVTIVRRTKALGDDVEPYVLELDSCQRVEFSWRGDCDTVINGLPPDDNTDAPSCNKRGRPKLGVKSREVTLLPRHWAWLEQQRGGASASLRRLVEHAMKNTSAGERITQKQNQLHSLLTIFADDPGFEEATRALYRNSQAHFKKAIHNWPKNIQCLAMQKFNDIAQLHLQEPLHE